MLIADLGRWYPKTGADGESSRSLGVCFRKSDSWHFFHLKISNRLESLSLAVMARHGETLVHESIAKAVRVGTESDTEILAK